MTSHIRYVLSSALEEAVKVAEITKRPLLLRGEPGTGKTLLAEHIAQSKKYPLFQWHIKSSSQAKDGLYFYDAITRLNDARFQDIDKKTDVRNIKNYIRFEAMGKAFLSSAQVVLLIDEIDKADIEFPNDLLLELDQMEFIVKETSETIKAQHRPLTIITSNNEKELPDAFLRRCIFHYIEFPKPDFMKTIVLSHFPDIQEKLLQHAIEGFYRIREINDLKKKPSTSELIDWIQVLLHQGVQLNNTTTSIPFIGTLIKNEQDITLFR